MDIVIRDLGFSPFYEGYPERGEALAAELSVSQIEALKELESHRRVYFRDLRDFARRKAESILEDPSVEDKALRLAIASNDLALRMSNKFQLQMAEIILFGERQGDLPTMETDRFLW